MTPSATQQGSGQAPDKSAIRPFRVNVPDAELTDLRRRVAATRLPERETVTDFSQGVPLATVQKLARYWATEYDWRKVEARLNAVPNFITEIDGLDIHFIHVRSKHEKALPDTNMPGVIPPAIDAAALAGAPVPAGLSADEKHAYQQLAAFYKDVYYALFMGTRPQTLTALADSPVGLATFMIDHDARSLELIARSFNEVAEGLTRDDVLDNIMLFWLTNTGVSAARLYWERKLGFFTPKGVKIPVAASAFPDELYQAPKSWVEQAYPNLIHYNKLDKGGHFAAWEQPQLLSEEVRAGFRSLRG